MQRAIPKAETPTDQPTDSDPNDKAKRTASKRVRRACDRCRLKKWKCDGQSPCQPCDLRGLGEPIVALSTVVWQYFTNKHEIWTDCSYYESSRRRSRPEYIEYLENQLFYLKTIFRTVWPSIDVDRLITQKDTDEQLDEIARSSRWGTEEVSETLRSLSKGDGGRGILLDTMIERGRYRKGTDTWCNCRQSYCGRLELLYTIRDLCSQMLTSSLQQILLQMDLREAFGWHQSVPAFLVGNRPTFDMRMLPAKRRAKKLVAISVENASCLIMAVHRPSCDQAIDRLYDDLTKEVNITENRDLPLLLSLCALGELFNGGEDKR